MRNVLFTVLSATIFALNCAKYSNELGHCEAITEESVAVLVTNTIYQLFDPGLRLQHKELRFDLYTRLNRYNGQVLRADDQLTLLKSNFNAEWPVRFYIHGWGANTSICSSVAIKDAYLAKGDYNVFLLDWTDYALNMNYFSVAAQMFEIAHKFNDFTKFLNRIHGFPFQQMYLIAHSLGCHLAGVAGKLLKPDQYGVLYALDASGPLHRNLNINWRLASTDAIYVESIQTDIGLLGYPTDKLGHASFYPNWGLGQRHCPNATSMELVVSCDHFGALYYFVESLKNSRAFGAIRCKSYESIEQLKCGCGKGGKCQAQVFMGGDPAIPKRGIYYLSTRRTLPFGYGKLCRVKRALEPTAARMQHRVNYNLMHD